MQFATLSLEWDRENQKFKRDIYMPSTPMCTDPVPIDITESHHEI